MTIQEKYGFTPSEWRRILNQTGQPSVEVKQYLAVDFIASNVPIPDADELIEHINYQDSLRQMFNEDCDFDEAWCAVY